MTSRRSLLALALLPFGPPALAANAGAPMSKSQAGYQDVPHSGQVCAQCAYFVFKPASGTGPSSRCRLIAGPISPAGWCEVWVPAKA